MKLAKYEKKAEKGGRNEEKGERGIRKIMRTNVF